MFILDGVSLSVFFFFNDTATTEIYTLSLHDALPIWIDGALGLHQGRQRGPAGLAQRLTMPLVDRKSTRLNSSHQIISYAVFCLKKKKIYPPFVPNFCYLRCIKGFRAFCFYMNRFTVC